MSESSGPERSRRDFVSEFVSTIRRRVLTGLAVVVPIGLTVWILTVLFSKLETWLGRLGEFMFQHKFPGAGIVAGLILLYLAGMLAGTFVGRRLVGLFESLFEAVPIARNIFTTLKQVMSTVAAPESRGLKRVVMIHFPYPPLMSLAFVTNSIEGGPGGQKLLTVFVPTTPNPTSGYLLVIPADQAIETPLTTEQGIRMVVSGGIILPDPIPRVLAEAVARGEGPAAPGPAGPGPAAPGPSAGP